jgi:hypothetical protein
VARGGSPKFADITSVSCVNERISGGCGIRVIKERAHLGRVDVSTFAGAIPQLFLAGSGCWMFASGCKLFAERILAEVVAPGAININDVPFLPPKFGGGVQ